MSTKPSPETVKIAPVKSQATASSLMGFSNPLPACPTRLPDGTILDYSAVDETWTDVVGFKSQGELEESIFKNHQATKQPQVTPGHLLKHVTRVQSLAALVPSKEEAVEPVEVVKFDKPGAEESKGMSMKKWTYKKDPTEERMAHWRSGSAKGAKPEAECDMGERMSHWRSKSKKSA